MCLRLVDFDPRHVVASPAQVASSALEIAVDYKFIPVTETWASVRPAEDCHLMGSQWINLILRVREQEAAPR